MQKLSIYRSSFLVGVSTDLKISIYAKISDQWTTIWWAKK